jgi:hypothetical protein
MECMNSIFFLLQSILQMLQQQNRLPSEGDHFKPDKNMANKKRAAFGDLTNVSDFYMLFVFVTVK